MKSITEEMRFRQRLCEYALKHGVTKAARRYHTYSASLYIDNWKSMMEAFRALR